MSKVSAANLRGGYGQRRLPCPCSRCHPYGRGPPRALRYEPRLEGAAANRSRSDLVYEIDEYALTCIDLRRRFEYGLPSQRVIASLDGAPRHQINARTEQLLQFVLNGKKIEAQLNSRPKRHQQIDVAFSVHLSPRNRPEHLKTRNPVTSAKIRTAPFQFGYRVIHPYWPRSSSSILIDKSTVSSRTKYL
jgi:hypothetical protein